jgi:D-alanine-D-alanine ligase
MRIGITYDLCEDYALQGYDEEETVEFDCVETIAAIELALSSLGHATDRIGHARALIHRLGQGDRWDLVFNIAEGLHGFGRQALVPALLDSYEIPYTFSDPLTLSMTLHKGMAKHVARDLGIPTPDFEIIRVVTDLEKVALPFPLFVKPIAEGTSKGIGQQSKVRDRSELRSQCEHLLARYRQPVLVETFLPGRELTVGILGTGDSSYALGVMEILLQEGAEPEAYSYANKKYYEQRVRFRLAADAVSATATQIALDVWMGLGCRDGGRVDLRCDATGRAYFLEVNPLAGLHPDSDLMILGRSKGVPYVELIRRIVASALSRSAARSARAVPPVGDRHRVREL